MNPSDFLLNWYIIQEMRNDYSFLNRTIHLNFFAVKEKDIEKFFKFIIPLRIKKHNKNKIYKVKVKRDIIDKYIYFENKKRIISYVTNKIYKNLKEMWQQEKDRIIKFAKINGLKNLDYKEFVRGDKEFYSYESFEIRFYYYEFYDNLFKLFRDWKYERVFVFEDNKLINLKKYVKNN